MPNLSTLGSSSSLDGLVTNESLPKDAVVLQISKLGNVKQATMFVLTTATLAAGLLAQLPQLGFSAETLTEGIPKTIASTTVATLFSGSLLYLLKNKTDNETQHAIQAIEAILEFATGKYPVAAAEEFYNKLKAQAK